MDATSTGDTAATRCYTFGGLTVAVRTNDGKLSLILGDEQGSTNVMMPVTLHAGGALASATLADATASTRASYTPYGQLRGADNTQVDRGWLGQVEDRVDGATGTGLTYLNARYYDPATSRFISPDPLMNPGDPRTLDAYRYAENNPVAYTDATGLRITATDSVSGNPLKQENDFWNAHKGLSTFTGVAKNGSAGGGLSGSLPMPLCVAPPPPPPTCGTGFECGSTKDQFYSTWYGAGLGGLENWARGATDMVIHAADDQLAVACFKALGGGYWALKTCRPRQSHSFYLPTAGPSGFTDAQASYWIGWFDNPTLLVGGGGGEAEVVTNASRGLNKLGGVVSEASTNAAGGRVITSTGTITQNDFAGFVNSALMRGDKVEILTGVHGTPEGTMLPDLGMFADDVDQFGGLPGVTVHNVPDMSAEEISAVLRGPGTIIGGFCESGACLAPFH